MEEKKDKKYIQKLKSKYILAIYREESLKEVFKVKLTRLNVFVSMGFLALVLIALTTILIALTPLREYIPGYPDQNTRKNIIANAISLDSLQKAFQKRENYFNVLHQVINGDAPEVSINASDSTKVYDDIEFTRSVEDSLLRKQIEIEEQFNLSLTPEKKRDNSFSDIHFFAPIRGTVTNSFDAENDHFGTDIVTGSNKIVSATLEGTVTMATWTLATGYIIQVQHSNNLISVYKHNAELLKEVGTKVKAGEGIAIVGNSGELTTGPHLHFELWHNGLPIDPEKYILF